MSAQDRWDLEVDERERADVRQLIDRALGTEPELQLQPEAVLGQAQRRERTIRFVSAGSVVAAVAAATVGVALLLTGPSGIQAPPGPLVPGAGIERSDKPAPTKLPRTDPPPAPKPQTSQPAPTSAPVPGSPPPSTAPTAKPRQPGAASVPTDGPTAEVDPAP